MAVKENQNLSFKEVMMGIDVIIAEPHGFCGNDNFGVQGAIKKAQETAKKFPGRTYVLGEIVHNQHVVDELEQEYGIKTVHSLDEIPSGSTIVIRSHGATPETYKQAEDKGLNIIDATCPLVKKAHQDVKELAAAGKKIIYIASSKDHDEALGVAGEAPKAVTLTTLKELNEIKIADPNNTVVLTQTTLSILETEEALKKLSQQYPDLTIKPHICMATTERQKAIIQLAKDIGLVVIVGSPTSSNSNRLKDVAQQVGAKAYIVDRADELNPDWFKGARQAALSSGASTPERLLEEVINKIKSF